MRRRTIHLHSMLVHPVLAFVPVGAVAFVLAADGARIGSFGPEVWQLLLRVALLVVVGVGILATVSGVLERRHLYVTWHRTHTLKLWLAVALVALAILAVGVVTSPAGGGRGVALAAIAGLVPVAGALTALGLKMTLGRQSLARTSYVPDLCQRPPIDILVTTAARGAEPADLVDVTGEGAA